MRPLFTLAIIAMLAADPAWAQSLRNGPIVLELPASTRALALGGAFVLAGNDPDAIFYNPALLQQTGGAGIAVQRYGSASTLGTLSMGRDWSAGGLAIGVQVLAYRASAFDPTIVSSDEAMLLQPGLIGGSDLVASLAYARTIKGIHAGVSTKIIEQRLGAARDATAALDLGLAKDIGDVTIGLAVQNLGPGLDIDVSSLPLPQRITLGASLQSQQVGPLDLVVTAAVSRRRDAQIVPASGVEISYWPIRGRTFIGRVGIRRVPNGGASAISFGAAFTGDAITVEYAFQEFDGSGAAHRVGLRWR